MYQIISISFVWLLCLWHNLKVNLCENLSVHIPCETSGAHSINSGPRCIWASPWIFLDLRESLLHGHQDVFHSGSPTAGKSNRSSILSPNKCIWAQCHKALNQVHSLTRCKHDWVQNCQTWCQLILYWSKIAKQWPKHNARTLPSVWRVPVS